MREEVDDLVGDDDFVELGDFVEVGDSCSAILHPCGILDTHKDNGNDDEERRKPNRDIEE